jgi:hypothetical protein
MRAGLELRGRASEGRMDEACVGQLELADGFVLDLRHCATAKIVNHVRALYRLSFWPSTFSFPFHSSLSQYSNNHGIS